jgi:hypothetical protein
MKYMVINELAAFCSDHNAQVIPLEGSYLAGDTSFPEVYFNIADQEFRFYVDDEFDDLKVGSDLLSVCVALRALESYDYAEDYLVWCTQHNFDGADMKVRDHFQNLGEVVGWFGKKGIKVFSFISDFDFELNAGPAQYLRENPNFTI